MPDSIETENETAKTNRNPLFWVVLIVIALVFYLVFINDRSQRVVNSEPVEAETQNAGEIDRSLLVPPGMRARTFIEQLRAKGQPYPLQTVYEKANDYHAEGSLADAHLLFFFSAREGHAEAMMKMAEMSDPTRFKAEDSLLDHADALQSYKWYQKVAEQGKPDVTERMEALFQWAIQASESGDPYARQLLLVVQ